MEPLIVDPPSQHAAPAAIVPQPRCSLRVREARPADLPFLDGLQKMHYHMVGWFPTKQMEGYVAMNAVLIAEESVSGQSSVVSQDGASTTTDNGQRTTNASLGYIIARDSYNGRDDVGVIYQLNVTPHRQRHLVGASLVRATFERAAYGCRLFCCWCAQDIHAGYFWQSVGFVPLAFRTGSRGRQRTHIFWQRRIRENDTATPWWFPSQTRGGAVREDRLVFPIPPGLHWREPMPVLLPKAAVEPAAQRAAAAMRPPAPKISTERKMAIVRSSSAHLQGLPPGKAAVVTASGIRYVQRADYVPEPEPAKPRRAPRPPSPKNDPRHTAAARELRDRFLEEINSDQDLLLPQGKYEVARQLPGVSKPAPVVEVKALPQAA